ncbi:tandem-95 repeat protein [Catenovulum sp. 2E275]|uniref:Ig-like domain-containing protein n=1 Tax=Catenovulum sp. 2E275 TaxID=2980497 RepID=UPI0021D1BC81|nr:Ig-like domain-containing protein [Catenovulum sp. 2E275]MCU4677357.1 tandem-95 repeat protein [Catenovulum sp. 2E275]
MRLDNVAPSELSITTPIEIDGIINGAEDNDVLITGSGAESGGSITVIIHDGANSLSKTLTAGGSGNWTLSGSEFDVSSFNNGNLTISATQTDAAGNTSSAASTTVTLDNTAPSTPVITTPIEIDNIVNAGEDDTVLISGSGAEANVKLTIIIDSISIETTSDANGDWTIESNELDISALNNGSLTVTVNQTDSAGNTSANAEQEITLDNSAPSAPVIINPIATDNIINASEDEAVYLSGTAESGAKLNISITDTANNAAITTQVTADSNGSWNLSGNELDVSGLTNGELTISATQTDTAGNISSAVSETVTLDNMISSVDITTPIEGDNYINAAEDNDVLITGSGAETNATVSIQITDGSNTESAQVTADGSGNWTLSGSEFDVSSFNNGNLTISATQTDAAGNTSSATSTTVTLDNTAPSAPVISTPVEGDNYINAAEDNDVLITGSGAESNTNVTVTISSDMTSLSKTVTSDSSGNWTLSGSEFDVSGFNNGSLTISATQTDAAGNTSSVASSTVTLDNMAPSSPEITTPIEIDNVVNAGEDDTVLISGSGAEPGATLLISIDGVQTQVIADASGNWTIATQELDISALNNGSLTVTVVQTDSAGNTSSSSTSTITLDNNIPDAPVIISPIEGDNVINAKEVNTVIVTGTGESGANINLSVTDATNNSTVNTQVTVDTEGHWSLLTQEIDLSTLADGELTISANQTDSSGNTSLDSTVTVLKDTQLPKIASFDVTSGDFNAGDLINITVNLTKDVNVAAAESTLDLEIGSVTKQAGFVSATQNSLHYQYLIEAGDNDDDGIVIVANSLNLNSGSVEDSAQNPLDITFTNEHKVNSKVDTQAPEQPILLAPLTITTINANNYIIQGTHTEDNIEIQLYLDADNDGQADEQTPLTVTSVIDGKWSIDVELTDNATHNYVVKAEDKAGNTSILTDVSSIVEDSTNPADFEVGISQNLIDLTNDTSASFVLNGGEIGSTYQYTIRDINNNEITGSGLVSAESQLIEGIDVSSLVEGKLTISVTLTDMANNHSNVITDTVEKLYQKAPVITQGESVSVNMSEDASPQAFVLSLDATDANNDSLVWSVQTAALHGLAAINNQGANASVHYTPEPNFNGSDSFIIQVSDGIESDSILVNVNVNAVNDAPVGQSLTFILNEDSGQFIEPILSDIDSDSLSVIIKQNVQNGTLNASGLGWHYQPNANFNGDDSFIYTVSDGEAESVQYTVNLKVNAVNDLPTAQPDTFTMIKADNDQYTLDVLANDSDIDGDALILEGAKASVGSVTISGGQLLYQAPANFVGNVSFSYSLRDGNKGRAQSVAQLQITGTQLGQPPIVTAPNDVEVNATALFTKVNLGVATATDALGNPLPVSLVDGSTLFKPGKHKVYWQATDGAGNQTTVEQNITIHPLVSLGKDQTLTEGNTVNLKVFLNGPAPEYPVIVPFSVGGSAINGTDFELSQSEIEITSGTQAQISFELFTDNETEVDETIIITLDDSLNLGAASRTTIRVSESNIAPNVTLSVSQNSQKRLTVSQSEGIVQITASVTDPNPNDSFNTSWLSENINNLSSEDMIFEFEPADIAVGVYPIEFTATDAAGLTAKQTVYIDVQASLTTLTGQDSDGDLIPDEQEGYADEDGDGIPDYLDSINDCNVIPEQVNQQNGFLVEGEPGICLRKGATSAISQTGGLLLDDGQVDNQLGADNDANNVGGVFDFIAYGLPQTGQNYKLVLPQVAPVPEGAVYRKFSNSLGWYTFVEDTNNLIHSSLGEPGICPPPGDASWIAGLTPGHWCVQLTVEDGGPNDNDGLANGSIIDPGGVAVINTGNIPPNAENDLAQLAWNTSVTVDVLNNDSDADGDIINITSVSASFGEVIINADNTINYTPNVNYAGNDLIQYGITDNKGGTDAAQVSVTIKPNRNPIAQIDTLNIDGSRTVEINVLINDSDIDGDSLIITSAAAMYGTVNVVNNRLMYDAKDYIGEDTINYTISDGQGGQANSSVNVTVTGPEVIKVTNQSSGGSTGIWGLFGLVSAIFTRKKLRQYKQAKGQK